MADRAGPRVAGPADRGAVTAAREVPRHPARHFRALALVLRTFALFAVVTGVLDVLTGTRLLVGSGAHLSAAAAADPVLNSQIQYLGAVWAGFGGTLWWVTRDLGGRAPVLHLLLGTVFLGGIGRLLAAVRFGSGPPMLAAFIAIELLGSGAVFAWHQRLLRARDAEDRATA